MSNKFRVDKRKAKDQGVLLTEQAKYPRTGQGISSSRTYEEQIKGTMFEKPHQQEPSLFDKEKK